MKQLLPAQSGSESQGHGTDAAGVHAADLINKLNLDEWQKRR